MDRDITVLSRLDDYITCAEIKRNFHKVVIFDMVTLWFSYRTVIAFTYKGEFNACVNRFSNTTGKHLNMICHDKKKRLSRGDFLVKLNVLRNDINKFNDLTSGQTACDMLFGNNEEDK